jgi:preprotein translocase subunit YajC
MQANAVNVFMGIMSGFDPSECLLMLAQAAAPAGGKPPEVNPLVQFMPFILMGLMGYFMLLRPQQKEARRRQELLANLKKNDKVVTVGGMIGTIADFSSDGTRVTLKVDDTTRIRFLRSSIQGPLDDKSDGDSSTAAG